MLCLLSRTYSQALIIFFIRHIGYILNFEFVYEFCNCIMFFFSFFFYSIRSDMRNLGSSWTGPTVPRTAAARSLLVAAILSKNDLDIKTSERKWSSKERRNNQKRKPWSNVVRQPHLSVRPLKTSLHTITHFKSTRQLSKSNPRSHSQFRFRQQQLNYSPQYEHSRHYRNCQHQQQGRVTIIFFFFIISFIVLISFFLSFSSITGN